MTTDPFDDLEKLTVRQDFIALAAAGRLERIAKLAVGRVNDFTRYGCDIDTDPAAIEAAITDVLADALAALADECPDEPSLSRIIAGKPLTDDDLATIKARVRELYGYLEAGGG